MTLREIREREQAATPGKWLPHLLKNGPMTIWAHRPLEDSNLQLFDANRATDADVVFAANARQDIPFLLNEIDRLTNDIAKLEVENKKLLLKTNNSLANNLCPDHRDKQAGKACLACEIEQLHAALDMIERRTP